MPTLSHILKDWLNQEVTVVNPQSFAETMVRDVVRMETYKATIQEIGDDFLRLTYTAQKRNVDTPVDQVIPIHEVKRVSVWGDEKLLHL
jgi:hypothetical protein